MWSRMLAAVVLVGLASACTGPGDGDDAGGPASPSPNPSVRVAADCRALEDPTPSPSAAGGQPRNPGAAQGDVGLDGLASEISQDMRDQHAQASPRQHRYPEPGTIHSVGRDEQLGRVRMDVTGGDEAALAELTARYGAQRICLHRFEPPEPPDTDGPVRPLVKAEEWRAGLDGLGDAAALVEIAYDRATAERAWAANVPSDLPPDVADAAAPGVIATLDDVDFDHETVMVWSSGESGSCPGWMADVRTDADGTVHLERDRAGGPICSLDYNPYRMVLAVDRDRLPPRDALPTDDVAGPADARVRAYP